jgi:hypothetical protein
VMQSPETAFEERTHAFARFVEALCRYVAGSISDEVIGFFSSPNPSGAVCPGVQTASNRNEYSKHLKK